MNLVEAIELSYESKELVVFSRAMECDLPKAFAILTLLATKVDRECENWVFKSSWIRFFEIYHFVSGLADALEGSNLVEKRDGGYELVYFAKLVEQTNLQATRQKIVSNREKCKKYYRKKKLASQPVVEVKTPEAVQSVHVVQKQQEPPRQFYDPPVEMKLEDLCPLPEVKEPVTGNVDSWFREFWDAYPRQSNIRGCRVFFQQKCGSLNKQEGFAHFKQIMEGLRKWKEYWASLEDSTKAMFNSESFLRDDQYLSNPPPIVKTKKQLEQEELQKRYVYNINHTICEFYYDQVTLREKIAQHNRDIKTVMSKEQLKAYESGSKIEPLPEYQHLIERIRQNKIEKQKEEDRKKLIEEEKKITYNVTQEQFGDFIFKLIVMLGTPEAEVKEYMDRRWKEKWDRLFKNLCGFSPYHLTKEEHEKYLSICEGMLQNSPGWNDFYKRTRGKHIGVSDIMIYGIDIRTLIKACPHQG